MTKGSLIVAPMSFKGFLKALIFTENFYSTQNLSFWSNLEPIYSLKLAKIINSDRVIQISQKQGPISFQFSIKTLIAFCSIWDFLGTNGPSVKDQDVTV